MSGHKRRRISFTITEPRRHEDGEISQLARRRFGVQSDLDMMRNPDMAEGGIGHEAIRPLKRQAKPAYPTVEATATQYGSGLAFKSAPLLIIETDTPQSLQRFPQATEPASPANLLATVPIPAATISAKTFALQETGASGTALAITQTPEPSNMAPKPDANQQMTKWTEKVLIAALSIGGALLLAFALVMMYRWRRAKKFKRETEVEQNTRPYANQTLGAPWNSTTVAFPSSLREKPVWDMNSSSGSLLSKPPPAYARPDTASSMRPSILGLQQQPSRSPFPPPNRIVSPSPLAERSVLYIDPRESRLQFTNYQRPRRASLASSASLLPIEGPRKGDDGEKRRSSLSEISPLERIELRETGKPKVSQFSWSNSQASKTPMDVSRMDTSRFSVATSASSVPRYRSVESWVGQQATRLEESQFQAYLEHEIESGFRSHSRNASGMTGGSGNVVPPKKNYSERSTPFFMHHPGTEVPLPRGSRVPSEILDSKIGPREL